MLSLRPDIVKKSGFTLFYWCYMTNSDTVWEENSVENNCGAEWVRTKYSKQEMKYMVHFRFLLTEERGGGRADQTVGPNPDFTAALLYSSFSFISSHFNY